MVRAWHIEESKLDENKLDKDENELQIVDLEYLKLRTGVIYWHLNPDTCDEDGTLDEIRKARGYTYADVIEVSSDKLPNFDVMVKKFANEHLHTDEEIRFILEGKGYFDVRDAKTDNWIRVEVIKGDLIVLPAGIYHRLVLDKDRYIKAKRLFVGEPVWTPHDRPADDLECRKQYIAYMSSPHANISQDRYSTNNPTLNISM